MRYLVTFDHEDQSTEVVSPIGAIYVEADTPREAQLKVRWILTEAKLTPWPRPNVKQAARGGAGRRELGSCPPSERISVSEIDRELLK